MKISKTPKLMSFMHVPSQHMASYLALEHATGQGDIAPVTFHEGSRGASSWAGPQMPGSFPHPQV